MCCDVASLVYPFQQPPNYKKKLQTLTGTQSCSLTVFCCSVSRLEQTVVTWPGPGCMCVTGEPDGNSAGQWCRARRRRATRGCRRRRWRHRVRKRGHAGRLLQRRLQTVGLQLSAPPPRRSDSKRYTSNCLPLSASTPNGRTPTVCPPPPRRLQTVQLQLSPPSDKLFNCRSAI